MKKIAFLLAALLLLTAGLAGCGGNDGGADAPQDSQADVQEPAGDAAADTGDAAPAADGTLVMGTEATFPPYEFTDADGSTYYLSPADGSIA